MSAPLDASAPPSTEPDGRTRPRCERHPDHDTRSPDAVVRDEQPPPPPFLSASTAPQRAPNSRTRRARGVWECYGASEAMSAVKRRRVGGGARSGSRTSHFRRASTTYPATMSDTKPVVYLEDLEGPTVPQKAEPGKENEAGSPAVASNAKKDATSATTDTQTTGKRQRTLVDMFSSSSGGPATKKAKLVKTSSSTSVAGSSDAASTSSATRTLNSIPFSMSEYLAALSEDEKRLLTLECETMGKSW